MGLPLLTLSAGRIHSKRLDLDLTMCSMVEVSHEKEFVVPLAISTLSLLVAVGSAFLADKRVSQAVDLSNQVNEQFAKVKPWAFKQDALESVIDESRISAAIRGKDSSAPETTRVRGPQPAKIDRRYGDPKAQFTLIEYSDFECTFCKQYFAVPKALADGSRGISPSFLNTFLSTVMHHAAKHTQLSALQRRVVMTRSTGWLARYLVQHLVMARARKSHSVLLLKVLVLMVLS